MRTPIGLGPGRSASSASSGRYVTCTVVSVIPYMLTSRGPRSWRAYHGRSVCSSSASPPKMMVRSRFARSHSASAAMSC
ncbi:hypothetical protein BE20_22855 [Sorangium cellulosum]|nr:hypothetical protein BE20_22855 [Sorangium cellulosum]